MKVVEYLYEFDFKGWEVRIWLGNTGLVALHQYITQLPASEKKTPPAFAEALTAYPGVNAVQVKYNKHESVLIYPDWP